MRAPLKPKPCLRTSLRLAIASACLLVVIVGTQGSVMLYSQAQPAPVGAPQQLADTGEPVPVLNANQLDDLVAPIALNPDPLLSQILVAATYPIELVAAYQWRQRNPGLTGASLTQAAQGQMWDPSVQALVIFPDVMKRLNEDIAWTTNLGNAFLSQQNEVMDAVQRMREKANQAAKLVSTPQQQVITATESGAPVVQILPANPEVLYVPVVRPGIRPGLDMGTAGLLSVRPLVFGAPSACSFLWRRHSRADFSGSGFWRLVGLGMASHLACCCPEDMVNRTAA